MKKFKVGFSKKNEPTVTVTANTFYNDYPKGVITFWGNYEDLDGQNRLVATFPIHDCFVIELNDKAPDNGNS